MKTRSVDLTAYLDLCGIMPTHVTLDGSKHRTWTFGRDTPGLGAAIRAFESGEAMVPVRAFCEARCRVKDDSGGKFTGLRREIRYVHQQLGGHTLDDAHTAAAVRKFARSLR